MICISKHMQVGLSPDGSIALFSYNMCAAIICVHNMCAAASRMLYCTINNIPATADVNIQREKSAGSRAFQFIWTARRKSKVNWLLLR